MKKIVVIIIACLLLASCGSLNPYNVPEDEGAYLKNREEYKGKAKFIYKFYSAVNSEGKSLLGSEVDFFTGRFTTNKIPSGEILLEYCFYNFL